MLIFISLSDVMSVLNNTAMECVGDVTFRRVCSGNSERIKCSECGFLALGIQHAILTRHIAICAPLRSATFSPHYPINYTIFGKKFTHKMCFHFLYDFVGNIFIPIRTERDVIKTVWWCLCKVPAVLVLV